MHYRVKSEATIGAYGDLMTDRHSYRPLDKVTVQITGRARGDEQCRVCVHDASLERYYKDDVRLSNNRGEVSFIASGTLGVHWIYLYFPDSDHHMRYTNFVVDCETSVETGDSAYDRLYPITKEAMLLGRRVFDSVAGRFVGYISGDTLAIDGIWLRDWIYQMPAYKYWERELTCGLDRFLEAQEPNGSTPDGIKRDGTTWRQAVEADVEYILVLGVWETYRITGDDSWLARVLPYLEKALRCVRNDERRWDERYQLVKRGHTCDTWDFEINETPDFVAGRSVVAVCDQSGYYLAYRAMAEIYSCLGNETQAAEFEHQAEEYRRRANDLLWDGGKYLHHVHLTSIEHPGFDETRQLAMGNVWAVTRGLANHDQAVSLIKEYRKRHKETGDAFPWWSLQPGYPDELGYYEGAYCKQGGYANGGLMPWVGGELCLAAFEHGMESYGVELYHQYTDHLRRTGNRVHVWYWPDGQAGFRTTNEVPYTGWGMAQWLNALIEGLAGIKDKTGQMRTMQVSPRWAATAQNDIRVISRYAVNDSYFAYHMKIDSEGKNILIRYCGSGKSVHFHVMLPSKWRPKSVSIEGKPAGFSEEKIEGSIYANFCSAVNGVSAVEIICR